MGRLDVQAGAQGAGRAEIPGAGQHAEKAQGYGKGFQQKSTVSSVEEEMGGGKGGEGQCKAVSHETPVGLKRK